MTYNFDTSTPSRHQLSAARGAPRLRPEVRRTCSDPDEVEIALILARRRHEREIARGGAPRGRVARWVREAIRARAGEPAAPCERRRPHGDRLVVLV